MNNVLGITIVKIVHNISTCYAITDPITYYI